jgi:type 1 glutamine amidotransferase
MGPKVKFVLLSMALASGVGWYGCTGGTEVINHPPGSGGSTGAGSGGTSGGSGGTSASGGSVGSTGGSGSGSGGNAETGSGGTSTGSGGGDGPGSGGSGSGTGGIAQTTGSGGSATGGATGSGGAKGSGGATGSGASPGTGGGTTTGSGGGTASGPINVLIWNNALAYGHEARVGAITYLKMRESTDNIVFDTKYAHTAPVQESPSDTSFDASVFTDAGLDKYDVVMFLDTTGTSIDDSQKATRRQALQDFIEKKGRGYVGTHSATDTYQGGTWPWYVDFVGANFMGHSGADTSGTAQYFNMMTHPILTAAKTPNPWNRKEEWYTLTRDVSKISGITVLLTCHDSQMTQERPSAWVHEMPMAAGATQAGRMFYTAFGHYTAAFKEKEVMDMIVAGIKWAAHRL